MNIYYDFTETGGFPLDQGVLNDGQNGILLVEAALAAALGPLVIISGCVVAGSTVSAGVVALNGVIMPFTGGTLGTNVIPVPTPTGLTYFSGSILPSKITQVAAFGTDGVHVNPWTDFVRLTSEGIPADVAALETAVTVIQDTYWQTGDVKEIDVTEAYIAANFDDTGLGLNSRVGWAICNGNNGTVNRLGLVPVQRNPADTNFAAMGDTGGEETHLLTIDEMPSHTHIMSTNQATFSAGTGNTYASENQVTTPQIESGATGGGAAHNNLQPYIVTLFIQKL